MNRKITFLLAFVLLAASFTAKSQTSCPVNLDWELGNYSIWNYYLGNCCPVAVAPSARTIDRHNLTSSGFDPYGGFPMVKAGSYSLQLGNSTTGAQAERVRYNLHVPVGSSNYSLIYHYAVVLEDPGHGAANQPRMNVNAFDSITGVQVPCIFYDYVVSATVPGFLASPVAGPGGGTVMYQPWKTGNMKFRGYAGRTVCIDFTTADCGYSGHMGYGYVDMSCGLFAISTTSCGTTTATLAAPPGYSAYSWRDSATFSTIYGTTMVSTVPIPSATTTYAVILTPYTGYGCPDTLFTKLVPTALALHPSNDTTICAGATISLTSAATDIALPLTYSWAPSTGITCPTCDPITVTPPTGVTEYTVTVVDAGGCRKDTVITVTTYPIPTAILGPTSVCVGGSVTLSNATSGGNWTASNSNVTIGSATGVLTGNTVGTSIITYGYGGGLCYITSTMTVNPNPAPITGTASVCVGLTRTFSDATPGGTWSTTSPSISIGSTSGIVTGITGPSSATITYRLSATGCYSVLTISVVASPNPISTTGNVCVGATTTVSTTTPGCTWTSSLPGIAIVGSSSGIVTGMSPGTTVITATSPAGCTITTTMTVNPPPPPIGGVPAMCADGSTILTDATSGGVWSSGGGIVSVGSSSGVVTPIPPSTGPTIVTYTLPSTGCFAIYSVTVNPVPSFILGVTSVCLGSTTLLTSTPPGGTWTSSAPGTAPVGGSSGIVTGIGLGSATITYTLPTGCDETVGVTVYANPAPIAGPGSVCVGGTITLSDATAGGTWSSSSPSTASIGLTTGVVIGGTAGTATITYRVSPTGCVALRTITVNPNPAVPTGPTSVCQFSTVTLSDATPGGAWSSSAPGVASISSGGIVTGLTPGTSVITYTMPSGCFSLFNITVNPIPAPIIGPSSVCIGGSTMLSDATPGGTWTATPPGVISIGLSTGAVSSIALGSVTITYMITATGCMRTTTFAVTTGPAPITGPMTVCQFSSVTLSDGTGGGTWSSSTPGIATIGSLTGIVTSVGPLGPLTITYSVGSSCMTTRSITVVPLPGAITGTPIVCSGGTTNLSCTPPGGTWSSSPGTGSVSIDPSTGVATGGAPGTAIVTYTAPNGCIATRTITVNPLPAPITGPGGVCVGSSITLSDATPGGTYVGGTGTGSAIVGSTGTVTGLSIGTVPVTYTITLTGCAITTTVNVTPFPTPIAGVSSLCQGSTITLSDGVPGGVWSSSAPTVGSISPLGVVTGVSPGTTNITYSLGTGCAVNKTLTITPAPGPFTPPTLCIGSTVTLTSTTPGGTWTMGAGSAATIGFTTGDITGAAVGTQTVIYTLGGCTTTGTATVSPTPTVIGGPPTVCQGLTITLTNGVPGGTWSSSAPTIGSIDASTGVVTGILPGNTVIAYSIGGVCNMTKTITVNPISPIVGSTSICVGLSTTLTNATVGGVWSTPSSCVGLSGGTVTGLSAPCAAPITYSLPSGCFATTTVNVNSVPAPISGPGQVCVGSSITLSDVTLGGTWASASSLITIGGTTGIVTGITPGTAIVTYSLGSGCTVTGSVVVNPLPAAITGASTLCVGGLCINLSDATPGGSWSTTSFTISVNPTTGQVCGASAGSGIVTYTVGSTGCLRTKSVTVNPGPPAISGDADICVGTTTILSDPATGGIWSSSSPAVGTVSSSGVVGGRSGGITTISYSISGCAALYNVTVVPNPTPILIAPDTFLCVGVTRTLSDATVGGTWATNDPTLATIGVTSGIINPIATGTVLVSYTMGSGCRILRPVIIRTMSPIIGPSTVCQGMTISLSDTTMGGTWSSSNPGVASVVPASMLTSIVTGNAVGTATISYNLLGCRTTHAVSVLPAPPPITGVPSVCVGQVTVLSNATTGGTWSSSNPSVATVTGGMVVGITPGTTVISYTLGTGCPRLLTVTVFGLPPAIAGSPNVCVGQTTLLTNPAIGGTWTSGATGIATVGLTSGLVSGLTVGSAPITYTIGTGCATSTVINVIPNPAPITGSPNVCLGFTTTLADATFGGAWSSSTPSIASVNPSTGDVLGVATGTATITYLMPSGCYVTFPVTVNPLPPAIIGSPNICEGSTTTLSNPASGGSWTSSNPGYATIGVSSGFVNAIAAGTTTIVYTIGSSGCFTTMNLTVDPMPTVIGGATNICVTTSSTLTNGLPGGAWSSSNTNATIDIATGVVTGVAPGTATITYMMPSGCYVTIPVSISPLPTAISGHPYVCIGSTVTFSDGVPGGIWSSTNTTVAPIGSLTGTVYGANLGTSVINYTLGPGCVASLPISVVPLPVVFSVTGGGNYCSGTGGVRIGLNGSQVGTNYLLYRGSTPTGTFVGTGVALDFGLQTVGGVYTVVAINTPSGCSQLMAGTATIGVIPSVIPSVTMLIPTTDTVCTGASATFTALPVNGGSSPTYVWSVNGTNVALGNSYAFIPADGDLVKVTMTSNATCAAPLTATNEVRMSVLPQGIPTATLTVDPGDHVCTGTQVSVIAAAEFGGTAPSFIWRVNGVTVPGVSGGVLAYEPDNGDVIYCAMSSNYPCRLAPTATSNSVRMIVDTPITPIVVVDGVPGTMIGWGQYDTLVATVTSGVGPFTYQWILNGVPVVGATTNTYISNKFNHPKQDSVVCMVTSSGICPVTTFGWVYINSTNVGVKPVLNGANDITVIPNPNQGVFVVKGTLATTTDEDVTMEVTNVLGQVVYKDVVTAKQGKLNQQIQLSKTLANGMYILSLRTGSESRVFHVVVEQ